MVGRPPAARLARQLALLALALLALAPVGWRWPDAREAAGLLAAQAGRMAQRLRLPFEIARLQLREPDRALAMPVEGARTGRIASTWQAPRTGGRRHEGQDIFAPRGTPVRSATEGFVVRVGTSALGGRVASVLGAGGRVYYYAHLDAHAPGLAVGQRVRPGTLLGRVGTSGNARGTPPHLHFGVYGARGAIDPLPLLADPDPERCGHTPASTCGEPNRPAW